MSKRSRTRERRAEREKQRQRRRQMYVIGAVVIVAVVILILALVSNQPAEAPIPDDILERYNGFEVSQTETGYYRLGSPDAPVRVVEYSSFSCPGCAQFHSEVFDDLVERVERGEISFTYVPLQTGGIPNAEGAARTALCAGEQGRFWEMHDVLFDWQLRFGNNAFSTNRIQAGVDQLGLDAGAFNSCFNSSDTDLILRLAFEEGVSTTPTVAVNDTPLDVASLEAVNEAIDNALAFVAPDFEPTEDEPEAEETAEAEATEESEDMEATEEAAEVEDAEEQSTDNAEATEDADEAMESENMEEQSADDAESEDADEADSEEDVESEATEESES